MKHAPSVVIISWQRWKHVYSSLRYKKCSVSCHHLMTTVRAWLVIFKVWNMIRQLPSWHDNGQSMVIHPLGMKHAPSDVIISWQLWEHGYTSLRYKNAPSVVIISWQRSEHGYSSLRYETCSNSCHREVTTVRAWLFIPKLWNFLRQLSSPHDNGQSIVIHL